MAKYNSYIELSPHYESVVSIETESNHPDMAGVHCPRGHEGCHRENL
jgi:hypothetical protein